MPELQNEPYTSVDSVPPMSAITILIVDDDAATLMLLEELISEPGYQVVGTALTGKDGIRKARDLRPDIVIMDIMLPGEIDGIRAAQIIKDELDIPSIFLTGNDSRELLERAKCVDAYGYLMKPVSEAQAHAAIEVALSKKQADDRLLEKNRQLSQVLGERDVALKNITQQIEAILNAAPDPVFIIEADGAIVMANRATAKRLGTELSDLLGRCAYDFLPPDLAAQRRTVVDSVVVTGEPCTFSDERDGRMLQNVVHPICVIQGEITHCVVYSRDITDTLRAREQFDEQAKLLSAQKLQTSQVNTALEVLLQKSAEYREKIGEEVCVTVKKHLSPYVQKLKSIHIEKSAADCVAAIESSLEEIVGPYSQKLSLTRAALTLKENQIANLIMEGKTTKEIAEILGISAGTVDFHRNNIREKLDIKNKGITLQAYLLTLE